MSDHNDVLIERSGSQDTVLPIIARRKTVSVKMVGLTVLACLLLAGQAVTTYFVVSQQQHLSNLEEGTNHLRKQLSQRNTASGGTKMMHIPVNTMPLLKDFSDLDAQNPPPNPTSGKPRVAELDTKCKLEASKKVNPGVYKPQCDEQGDYMPMQCWSSTGYCWCVDKNGNKIPETLIRGRPQCQ
ncbi:CD74 molecule, major histocompatibility complex, class II invariant chain a isoform X2 [Denticeps clupeoides]|uniref:CD74 molecule, major histocompatibility complex, class II invariant chain a isoform X2 n=1 Tax=Denticeps clupeoides TaxID=299321 RepID=UPI0010A30B33|nr:H-2 class II histocompatibility antigen gamma chain-like isoform X2 [Denticeps clupeoides]